MFRVLHKIATHDISSFGDAYLYADETVRVSCPSLCFAKRDAIELQDYRFNCKVEKNNEIDMREICDTG